MKACLATLLFTVSTFAVAASSSPASPLFGRWTVDVSRLPIPAAARPRSATIRFGDAGDGKLSTQVDIVDAAGGQTHEGGITSLDGKPSSVSGNGAVEADTAATTLPSPRVLVMVLSKGGLPGSTRVFTVADDGQSMTETATYFGDGGVPIVRTHYFKRVP